MKKQDLVKLIKECHREILKEQSGRTFKFTPIGKQFMHGIDELLNDKEFEIDEPFTDTYT